MLSVSEAHDRIVYSVREGSAVSSHPSYDAFMILIIALLGCWLGIIHVHKGVAAAALYLHARPLQKRGEHP